MPRQPLYDAATNGAADAVCSLVLDFFRKHKARHTQTPTPASPAIRHAADARDLPGVPSLPDDPISEMWQLAATALFAAEDHALGMAELLRAEHTILTHAVAARSVVEAAGRVWWLLDPGIEVRDRIARSLGYQYEGHGYMADLLEPLVAGAPDHPSAAEVLTNLKRYEEELLAVAHTVGVLTRSKKGVPWAGERPPGRAKLAVEVQEAMGQKYGASFYNSLSGVAHGDVLRLAMFLRPVGHPEGADAAEGSFWSQPTMELGEVLNVTRRAVDVLVFAERVYWSYMGWEEVWAIDGMARATTARLQLPEQEQDGDSPQ